MADQAQSEYYQAIAREFLRRRGGPLFLSPRDLAAVAAWEKERVPLEVVLEGIGRAFDGLRDKSRGRKGMSLAFCDAQVQKALAQHADRRAGRRRPAAAPSRGDKAARARREAERVLGGLPGEDHELRPLFEKAAGLLAAGSPDEAMLETLDERIDEALWRRASRADREDMKRRLASEFPDRTPRDIAGALRTRLVKDLRGKLKIPYVSLFYY